MSKIRTQFGTLVRADHQDWHSLSEGAAAMLDQIHDDEQAVNQDSVYFRELQGFHYVQRNIFHSGVKLVLTVAGLKAWKGLQNATI